MESFKPPQPAETKLHFLDYWRIIRIRKAVIIAVFLLVVITVTVVSYMLPKTYMSYTRIKVEKDVADIGLLGGTGLGGPPDPFFLQTEFEVIQSKTNLYQVINELGLTERWSKEYLGEGLLKPAETFQILRNKIDVRQFRNTTMIEIRVYGRDKQEAAEIANKIADIYRDSRLSERLRTALSGIDKVKEELQSQKTAAAAAQEELNKLREEFRITDLMADSWSQGTLEADAVRRTDGLRVEALNQLVRYQSRYSNLVSLAARDGGRERLRNALPVVFPGDALLVELMQKSSEVRQQLIAVSGTLSEKHPDVVRLQLQLEQLEKEIEGRVDGIMNGLESEMQATLSSLNELTNQVAVARAEDISRAREYRGYFTKKRELENQNIMVDVLTRKLAQELFDARIPRTQIVQITDSAEEGLDPVRPNIPLNIVIGVIVGLVVGVGLAFFIEYLDTSVKTIDDVERALQAPVLGVIPQNVGSLLEEGPESPHAEAYRVLRTNLLFGRKDASANTITVVSGGAGEGKSTTLFNLATVFAQNGDRVLVVDSDLRRPSAHKLFKVSNSLGLTNYLLGQNKIEEVIQTSRLATLDFLPSGKLPSSSMGILNSAQMKELIKEVKRRYDFVFFDSPPIMGVSDAAVLASEVDLALQVIQYRKYPQAMTIRAKQMVEKVGGNLVGIVLNNINMSQDENYYYYSGYYYDYYSKRDAEDDGQKPGVAKNGSPEVARLDLKKKY
ncbi:MAG: GumC family protein [Limisphaerales bacterium]